MVDFSTQQIKMFKKLFVHPPKVTVTGLGLPEKFLLQFVLFEASARLVESYYRDRITQKKKSNAHTPLYISVVRRSFVHFGISVADERLCLLLDSNLTKRGGKSARELRNGLAHQWKAEDVTEVNARCDDLSNALTSVVDAIKARVYSCGDAP